MAEFGPSDVAAVLHGVGAIAQAMAIFAAAWIASNTFNGWRKQKLSERRIEQAERILTATYNARRALGHVRNPLVTAHEISAAQEYLERQDFWSGLSSDRRGRLKIQQPYFDRLNDVRNERIAVDDCLAMARALFGNDVETALQTLNHQFQLVNIAIDMYDDAVNDRLFQQYIRARISSAGESNGVNEMNDVIIAQIKIIEDHLFPILRLDIK